MERKVPKIYLTFHYIFLKQNYPKLNDQGECFNIGLDSK